MAELNYNKHNPAKHHRRTIRLSGYDYSQAGLYFITICCQNRFCFLGEIKNGEMILNDAGQMIKKWYFELENKFNDIRCHEMIIMPNHIHFIIQNVGANLRVRPEERVETVGANLRVRPEERVETVGANLCVRPVDNVRPEERVDTQVNPYENEHIGTPLRNVVGWFKTMTTNEYIRGVKTLNWVPFDGKFWQRNYYEHIIRNEFDYNRISKYIINNPINWNEDNLFN